MKRLVTTLLHKPDSYVLTRPHLNQTPLRVQNTFGACHQAMQDGSALRSATSTPLIPRHLNEMSHFSPPGPLRYQDDLRPVGMRHGKSVATTPSQREDPIVSPGLGGAGGFEPCQLAFVRPDGYLPGSTRTTQVRIRSSMPCLRF